MKFAIDIGHNAPDKDTGAIGINKVKEDYLTNLVGDRLIFLLKEAGHQVVRTAPKESSTINQSLEYRCQVANQAHADIFVSIHFNAFNKKAHGTEVYATSRAGKGIAQEILDEICKLGFYNRGVKSANFYVLKHTTMPAVLVECCFCDSQRDMERFKANSMARAIAEGLVGDLPPIPIEDDPQILEITQSTWVKATTEQSKNLLTSQKVYIEAGRYRVSAVLPEEERHHFVRLTNGTEGFVFAGHVSVS